MGLFKDLRDLKKTGGQMAAAAGRPTTMTGMLRQLPNDIANANQALQQSQGMINGLMAQQQRAVHLMTNGIPMRARVLAVRPTSAFVNGSPVAEVDLEVQAPSGPYAVTHTEAVPQVLVPRLVPGGDLGVRVDAADPHVLMLDWSAA